MRQITVGNLKVIGLAVAAAAIGGLAVFAATGFGGDGKTDLVTSISRNQPEPTVAKAHEVRSLAGGAGGLAGVAKSSKVKIKYFATGNIPIAGGDTDVARVTCPSGYKAISGYYRSGVGVVTGLFAIGATVRQWDTGVLNLNSGASTYQAGAVCANKVR